MYCANLRNVLVRWCASFELTVISDVERQGMKMKSTSRFTFNILKRYYIVRVI